MVRSSVVQTVINAHNDGDVFTLCRSGDDDLLGASSDVLACRLGVDEATRGLDDDVCTQCSPRKVRRFALSDDLDCLAINDDCVAVNGHRHRETTKDRVVLEKVRKGLDIRKVVDANDLNIGTLGEDGAEVVAANAAKAINTDLNGHEDSQKLGDFAYGVILMQPVGLRNDLFGTDFEPFNPLAGRISLSSGP